MKKFIKLIAFIMSCICVIAVLIPAKKTEASDGSITVSAPGSVEAGQSFEVTITVSSSYSMLVTMFNLDYDNGLVTCNGSGIEVDPNEYSVAVSNPAGRIPFQMEGKKVNKITIKVPFEAKKAGNVNFTINDVLIAGQKTENGSSEYLNLSSSGATTNITAQGSSDATLNSISISGVPLPGFAKWTVDYTYNVPNETTAVDIYATTSQEATTIKIEGNPSGLAVGNNVIKIITTAQSGKVMTYNINVVRAQAPAPEPEPTPEPATEPETETETEPVKDTTVTIDGKEYVISKTFPEDEIPDGYTAGTLDISGNTIQSVTNDVTGLNLVYLTDADENGAIYIYDKETKTFEKYIAFKSGKNVYVYLDASHASEKPEGMAETKCEIQGTEVKVYTPDKDSEFVYFYAVNSKGERIWYVYDTVEKTIQRSNNTPSQPAISDDNMQKELDSLKQDNDKLTESKESLIKGRNITFIAGGVVLAALIVLVVVLAAHKSEEKHSVVIPDEDDYDYDNEDDDSQSDNAQDEPDALLAAAEENTESGSAEEEQAATEEPVQDTEEETVVPEAGEAEETEVPETDTEEKTEAPETPSEPEVKEDDFEDAGDKITQADMDAFVTEAQQVDDEPAQKPSEIKPLKNDEDGLEIETEIIDLGDDIFDDDEKPAAKEPEKEPEKTGEEPETIELEPSDGDDEEFFL